MNSESLAAVSGISTAITIFASATGFLFGLNAKKAKIPRTITAPIIAHT
jgi:hypothetical protein